MNIKGMHHLTEQKKNNRLSLYGEEGLKRTNL